MKLTDEQMIAPYIHIPCSLIHLLYTLRVLKTRYSPKEIEQQTGKTIDYQKYEEDIVGGYIKRVIHFMEINKLTLEKTKEILEISEHDIDLILRMSEEQK